mmetsp:Transcript_64660/g.171157  ORF Transcript_64660/g.171157 Transcript_64660/m.171157 type:complete len:266 (-) Transcript_64660:271-1068(-)
MMGAYARVLSHSIQYTGSVNHRERMAPRSTTSVLRRGCMNEVLSLFRRKPQYKTSMLKSKLNKPSSPGTSEDCSQLPPHKNVNGETMLVRMTVTSITKSSVCARLLPMHRKSHAGTSLSWSTRINPSGCNNWLRLSWWTLSYSVLSRLAMVYSGPSNLCPAPMRFLKCLGRNMLQHRLLFLCSTCTDPVLISAGFVALSSKEASGRRFLVQSRSFCNAFLPFRAGVFGTHTQEAILSMGLSVLKLISELTVEEASETALLNKDEP